MNKSSEHRLAEHEVIFRDANLYVANFIEDAQGKSIKTLLPFYCECSNKNCRERIELTPKNYKSLHGGIRQFIALKGHETPEIEKIVMRKKGFNVIEKFGDPPGIDVIKSALKNRTLGC
jgi:hypothetical protein